MPSFRKRELSPNSVFDKEALKKFCNDHEIKEIHINKIHRLMLKNPKMAFSDIPGLPKQAAQLLQSNFVPLTSTLKSHSTSTDKKTTKLLIELQDGNMIETVIIRHSDTRSEGHNVVCVSSQIGCKMGCTFCATGTLGLIGNLRAAEILEQIAHAKIIIEKEMESNTISNGKKKKKNKKAAVRNIVFMGMGEPLDNYEQVKQAMEGMHDRAMFNLAWSHITLSTVGVVKRMREFTKDFPKANLALSLHAPSQIVRKEIVPTSTAFTVKKIMDAVVYHIQQTNNKIFIEYIMIGNVNCEKEHAEELGKLFVDNKITKKICINLIPYNPTDIGDEHKFEPPTDSQLEDFKDIIMKKDIFCTIRKSTTSGRDVDGACGQLALKGNNDIDIEDLVKKNKRSGSIKKRKKKLKERKNRNDNDKSVEKKKIDGTIDNTLGKLNKQSVWIGTAVLIVVGVTYFLYRSKRSKIKDATQ